MAGYPYTNQIVDDNSKKAIIAAFDRIAVLTAAQDQLQTSFTALSAVTVVTNPTTGVVTPIPPSGGTGLGSFNTGDLVVADTPSTLIGLPDLPPGNVLLAGGAGVRPFYGKVGLTTHVSGTLPVGSGGTNSTTTLSGSTIMISNGSAIVQGTAGTTTTVLHGNAGGAPTYGAVSLTADVSGDLPYANLVPATAISLLLGRGSAAGSGDWQEITLGANLTMTGTVLSASGGGSVGGATTQVLFNLAGVEVGDADMTFVTDTLTVTKAVMPTSASTPSLISTGAVTITPAAGSNLNIALSTTGDFVVNTTQFYVDTSSTCVGIGTVPSTSYKLEIDHTNVLLDTVRLNNSTSTAASTTINFERGGVLKANLGMSGTAGGIITGSAVGDLGFRSSALAILFSTNSGTSIHAALKGGQFSIALGLRDPATIDTSKLIVAIDAVGGAASAANAAAFFTPGGRGIVIRAPNSESSVTVANAPVIFTNTGVGNGLLISGASTPTNQLFLESTGNVGIGTTTPSSLLTVAGLINTKNYTVATLPAGIRGDIAYVTDALAPTFLAIVVGGGAVVAPVFYNGANWVGF